MARRTESDRKLDRFNLLRGNLVALQQWACVNHPTHAELLARENTEIFQNPLYMRITHAQRMQLSEVRRVWRDRMNQEMIVWRLGPESGPLAEDAPDRWDEGSELSLLCRQPGKLFGAHFWRGTDKLWGEWKATN